MNEMQSRGYNVASDWQNKDYRGKNIEGYEDLIIVETNTPIYKEHDDEYLEECIRNLDEKNIFIKIE